MSRDGIARPLLRMPCTISPLRANQLQHCGCIEVAVDLFDGLVFNLNHPAILLDVWPPGAGWSLPVPLHHHRVPLGNDLPHLTPDRPREEGKQWAIDLLEVFSPARAGARDQRASNGRPAHILSEGVEEALPIALFPAVEEPGDEVLGGLHSSLPMTEKNSASPTPPYKRGNQRSHVIYPASAR